MAAEDDTANLTLTGDPIVEDGDEKMLAEIITKSILPSIFLKCNRLEFSLSI